MDPDTRAFVLKVIGGAIAIALFTASSLTNPPLNIDPVLRGGLLVGGLGVFTVNIGATLAAGREAAMLRARRAEAAKAGR
jgi:hypothetical protein